MQEIAFTLANAIAYVEAALAAGLDVNALGERLSFFFNCHNDFLEEIAKFRAARRLWAHIMRERFGATSPRALQLRFHTQTAGSTLTAQQPDNNIVRVAIQALAAVLGGTQSLHCNGRDEALSLPTEDAARIALRTQQIIASETGVANTVDPLGGAYTIETLTDRLEADARALIDRIDHLGGTLAAIEAGVVQREIQESAYRAQQAIDNGDAVVVGVNRFAGTVDSSAPQIEMFQIDPEIEPRQVARVQAVRAGRNEADWRAAIAGVESAARGSTTSFLRFSRPSRRMPRSARSPTRCGASSASTVRRTGSPTGPEGPTTADRADLAASRPGLAAPAPSFRPASCALIPGATFRAPLWHPLGLCGPASARSRAALGRVRRRRRRPRRQL